MSDGEHAPAAQQAILENRNSDQKHSNSRNYPVAIAAGPGNDANSLNAEDDAFTALPAAGRQSLKIQAAALLRKNGVYQRRNMGTNICLLSSPIVFCVLLLVVQVALNKLLTGDDYKCGCQCTKCCFNGDRNNCTSSSSGTCSHICLERNISACGVEYSTAIQAAFCEIPHTSSWPSILQTPSEEERAAPHKPKVAFLYTGSNPQLAQNLTKGLVSKPDFRPVHLVAAQKYLTAFNDDMQHSATAVPAELLSLMGFRLGTSSTIKAGLYLEPALIGDSATLYTLWPEGTCSDLGLEGVYNTSLTTMLQAVSNASNSAGVARIVNTRLENITAMLSGDDSSNTAYSAQLAGIKLNCTNVVISKEPEATTLQRTLYCGYWQAACNGTQKTNAYAAAFDWRGTDSTNFVPNLYYNDTYGIGEGSTVYQRSPQILNMAVNSWLKSVIGADYSIELIGVMATPKLPTTVSVNLDTLLGALFFTWVIQMLLPVFLMQLVYEKEKRLRMMMKMHGLGDAAYWVVMYSWFFLLYAVYVVVLVAFGSAVGISTFRQNGYGIQFVLFLLFGNNMIALAFLMSCFFTDSKTATLFAYMLVFSTGILGSLLLSQLINAGVWFTTIIEFIPSFSLFRAIFELGEYATLGRFRGSAGMTRANLKDADNGMTDTWVILAVEWIIFMAAALYLEQVYASGTGNRQSPLFFLEWLPRFNARRQPRGSDGLKLPTVSYTAAASPSRGSGVLQTLGLKPKEAAALTTPITSTGGGFMGLSTPAPSPNKRPASPGPAAALAGFSEPEDVAAERQRAERVDDYQQHLIVVRRLNKTYAAQDGQPPKLAVQSLDLAIGKGECFGLLGPNGAGKSSSISMLVGLVEPSAGTALIGGHDITTDMDAIYSFMGVCPQHDLLWDTLTGREHLLFYGRLKGLKGAALHQNVQSSLRAVNLWQNGVCDKQVWQYSGGMKRRLSVAISFMGNPIAVYLDEPSTGLDPASRRNLWDVVKKNKSGRAIVLTTHSMEEAETLCDRLGIFVDGRLVCIGNPKEITSRYSGFLVFSITVPAEQESAARQLVCSLSPNARLTYSVGGTLKFELPSDEVSFSRVFALMTGGKAADAGLTVLDWGVANATLEEVFVKFARQIGAKASR